MKMILTVTFITLGVLLLASLMNKLHAETEIQSYETLYRSGNFEIRYYPQAILASVAMNGNYDNSRNSGFRVLAGYIFGGNETNQKIAMTAPVRMSSNANTSTMSFVLPSEMKYDQLPEPLNDNIVLHRSEPAYAAVVRYGGYTSNREIEKQKKELSTALEKLGIAHKGNFEYLGYNAPYDVFDRRNEVWVELDDFDPGILQSITVQ
jgi:hypothetical protein